MKTRKENNADQRIRHLEKQVAQSVLEEQHIMGKISDMQERLTAVENLLEAVREEKQIPQAQYPQVEVLEDCGVTIQNKTTMEIYRDSVRKGEMFGLVRENKHTGWCDLVSDARPQELIKIPLAYCYMVPERPLPAGGPARVSGDNPTHLGPSNAAETPTAGEEAPAQAYIDSLFEAPVPGGGERPLQSREATAGDAGSIAHDKVRIPDSDGELFENSDAPAHQTAGTSYQLLKLSVNGLLERRTFYLSDNALCWYGPENRANPNRLPQGQISSVYMDKGYLVVKTVDGKYLKLKGEPGALDGLAVELQKEEGV